MNEALQTKVVEMVDSLADKLGIAASKVWEWSLLQVKVDIIETVIWSAFCVLVTFLFYKLTKLFVKKYDDIYDADWEVPATIGMVLLGLGVFIFDATAIFAISELPSLIFNPEYVAFKNICKTLSQLK